MNMIFGKNSLATGFKLIWIVLAMLLPASSARASNTAVIFSGGSADTANPTPVLIGDALHITGGCAGQGNFDVPVRADYLIYDGNNTGQILADGSYKPKNWLQDSSVDVSVGTTRFTEAIGAKFHVELKCVGTQNTSYASRFFEVVAPQVAPSVAISGSWNTKYTKDNLIMIEAAVTSNGSGVGKVWIKWTGESATDIEMTNPGGDRYLYPIGLSKLSEGLKEVQIWAESPGHASNGWQTVGNFTVDRTAPTIEPASVSGSGTQFYVSAEVSDRISDVDSVWIRWETDNGWSRSDALMLISAYGGDYFYTIYASGMSSGQKAIQIRARDKTGNDSGWVAAGSFSVAHTPPAIEWDSANPEFANDSMPVRAHVKAANGFSVKEAWVWWKGAPSSGFRMKDEGNRIYSYIIPTTDLAETLQTVMFWANDDDGTASGWTTPSGSSFTVDRTAPSIAWREPLDDALLSGDRIHIAGTVDDRNPDKVVIEWQAETDTEWQSHTVKIESGNTFQYDLSGLTQGVNYRMRMHASDLAGNVSSATPARNLIGVEAGDLLKNSRLVITANSLVDKDDSGGFSPGDEFIYAVEILTGKSAANGLSLRYALPPGLAITPGMRPYIAEAGVGIGIGGQQLNAAWNGGSDTQLLASGVDLAASGKLAVNIPVTIIDGMSDPIASTVLIGAKNAKGDLKRKHRRVLQGKFPADQALDLALTSMQSEWKYSRNTAFDYRITVQVKKWDLSGVALHYALPQGLLKNGAARVEGSGAAMTMLNPDWENDGVTLLLSSSPGAMLEARSSFTVTIPVKIGATATPDSVLQSEVEASAANLAGPISATHRIVLEGSHEPEDQLRLEKTVDKKTVLPGETLHYTITFTNVGIDDLHDLVIRDSIQSDYLTLQNAQCEPGISKTLRCCVASDKGDLCGVASARKPGELEWHLDGALEAGDFGSVGYEVRVKRQ